MAQSECTYIIGPEVVTVDGASNYAQVAPGDTLCLPAGIRGNLEIMNLHGTAAAPIILRNSGGKVTINAGVRKAILLRSSTYIRVTGTGSSEEYGFDLTGDAGIHTFERTSYIEIDHLEIHDTRGAAVIARVQDPATIQFGINIHHNYIHDIAAYEGMYIGHADNMGGPIPVLKDLKISHNRVERTGREGIEVKSGVENVVVDHNTIADAGQLNLSGQRNSLVFSVISGNAQIYNNEVLRGNGHGIALSGSGPYEVFNNMISNPGETGLRWASGDGKVYDNHFVNGTTGGVKINCGCTGEFFDNILAGNTSISGSGPSIYNNLLLE